MSQKADRIRRYTERESEDYKQCMTTLAPLVAVPLRRGGRGQVNERDGIDRAPRRCALCLHRDKYAQVERWPDIDSGRRGAR